ncbi:phosphotransacetylase family protein [Coriobacteriia bacterium Es71-Z0120]|uniref:phosphotransacetylase family protein n=1 Tax=Parvivirga hydrogeniphila TaxID=2939460 RepID=UPI002260B5E9|nr:phosphotransacetylase family protein [Parvivirga hydrogeniphila]MCL4079558.1 phosphotransacetylase family protein [Parvivirga hydrogeniphila]
MRPIIIASTAAYSGKSGVALSLIRELVARGVRVGYFKPYGTMPVEVGGVLTDKDAAYINSTLPSPAPIEAVCPVVRTQALVEDVLAHRLDDVKPTVVRAAQVCGSGHDVLVVEAPWDLSQGSSIGVSAPEVAEMLEAKVVLIDRPSGMADLPDAIVCERSRLGDRLAGVIFNAVLEHTADFIARRTTPFLSSVGVPVFGAVPFDPLLSSVTVQEIADELGGTVLTAHDSLDLPVETFMVGAMGQEKALRFFRRKANKAVVTGGDRSDVQLAALETSTRCIVLTGNMPPSSIVMSRAEELGVPMVMVEHDTLTAVERLEGLFGHTRLHDAAKVDTMHRIFIASVDVDRMLAACGIPQD